VDLGTMALAELLAASVRHRFAFDSSRVTVDGTTREQQPVEGTVDVDADRIGADLSRLTVRISNTTALDPDARPSRDEALMRSLVSTHAILTATGGRFISMTDPPDPLRQAAADCRNTGAWPVLVGEPGQADTLLASPIILYDYPQIAPESPGDLFDATEIDEILSLRILTLTDDEKRQAADADPRVASLLARTESLARDQLMNLHGAVRTSQPARQPEGHRT
jgi:hydrogenase maturation protease